MYFSSFFSNSPFICYNFNLQFYFCIHNHRGILFIGLSNILLSIICLYCIILPKIFKILISFIPFDQRLFLIPLYSEICAQMSNEFLYFHLSPNNITCDFPQSIIKKWQNSKSLHHILLLLSICISYYSLNKIIIL